MLGILSRWRRPALLLVNLDHPVPDNRIELPQLDVRGWLAFDKPFDLQALSASLLCEDRRLPLVFESRPEVEAGLPGRFVVGFCRLFDLDELAGPDASYRIEIDFPGGSAIRELDLNFIDDVEDQSSYYVNRSKGVSPALKDSLSPALEDWQRDGFIVLREFYDSGTVDDICSVIEEHWDSRQDVDERVTVDEYIGSDKERRLPFRDANREIREQPYKLNDLFLVSQPVRETLLNRRLSPLLSMLLRGTPMICNSLYFERGSQQQDHFDTFFMPPLVRDRMLATWLALEDVSPDAGPLTYYPGSHLIEPYRFKNGRFNLNVEEKEDCYRYIEAELKRREIEPVSFRPAKGDLFIWHAQLFHGGEPIRNSRLTRRSLVSHYFCVEDWAQSDSVEYAPGCYYLSI